MTCFEVTAENEGRRVDTVLAEYLGERYSRTYAKSLVERALVKVNGKTVKGSRKLSRGDIVEFELMPAEEARALEAEDIPLDILLEDEHILAVNKSPGMVVHPAAGNRSGTLANALMHYCACLSEGGSDRPGIVHRLDKDTSGVILVAKDDLTARHLREQFRERSVEKYYLLLAEGCMELDNISIRAPVARHLVDRKRMAVRFTGGKEASTDLQVLERYDGFFLARARLNTGRTHQIRVHMAHIGHPVLGDRKYGAGKLMERQALHAERIVFEHPSTGKRTDIHCPMPGDMRELTEKR